MRGDGKLRVLVVCGTGVVCSAIVMASLEKWCSEHGLTDLVELEHSSGEDIRAKAAEADLIVTTVELPDGLGLPVLDGYELLYEDEPAVLAEFDSKVRELLGT